MNKQDYLKKYIKERTSMINFRAVKGKDDDILEFLQEVSRKGGNKTEVIKMAIRKEIKGNKCLHCGKSEASYCERLLSIFDS